MSPSIRRLMNRALEYCDGNEHRAQVLAQDAAEFLLRVSEAVGRNRDTALRLGPSREIALEAPGKNALAYQAVCGELPIPGAVIRGEAKIRATMEGASAALASVATLLYRRRVETPCGVSGALGGGERAPLGPWVVKPKGVAAMLGSDTWRTIGAPEDKA